MKEVTVTTENPAVAQGSAGIETQVGGQPTTASGAAAASGGLAPGNLIEPDIDDELFKFSSDDTPLMNLMLKAKTISVSSPEVDHYSIDEPTAMVTVDSVTGTNKIKLVGADKMKVHAYDVLSVVGVKGYTGNTTAGTCAMTRRPLQLFVTQVVDDDEFIVKADNGVKSSDTDEYGNLPTATSPVSDNTNIITSGTKLIILGNALYETQKEVDPDMVLPKPERQYLQKRGMNQVVSDYFESQRKRIPFSKAIIAEAAIRNFKVKGNRTLWISQGSKMRVKAEKTGDMQYVYKTVGVRWQFKREVEHTGKWTYEDFIALAKLFYTGEDVPSSCYALCGKNFMENIQCIDWSKHPEITIEVKTNKIGWKVTSIQTVFGEFQFKREPTLDRLGCENCAALLGEDRLVHYKRTAEKSFSEKVEGEEATRSGVLVWDALCLKGSCHIWVDGNGDETAPDATEYVIWNDTTGPTDSEAKNGTVYMFVNDATIAAVTHTADETTVTDREAINVMAGEMWQYTDPVSPATWGTWKKFNKTVSAR